MPLGHIDATTTMLNTVMTNPVSAHGLGLAVPYPIFVSSEEYEDEVTELPAITITVFDSAELGVYSFAASLSVTICEPMILTDTDSENITGSANTIMSLANGLQALPKFSNGYLVNMTISVDEQPYLEDAESAEDVAVRYSTLRIDWGLTE